MRQTNKMLIIATLVLGGALSFGCSVLDEELDTTPLPQDDNTVTLTTKVSFNSASTRALDANGVKTFVVGDQIAIFYTDKEDEVRKVVTDELVADDISDGGKTASFTVTLTNPQPKGYVRFIYPAAMAAEDGYGSASLDVVESGNDQENGKIFNINALATQDGTLKSISDGLDLCYYDGRLTEDVMFPDNPVLNNPLAICKFTIKNDGGSSDITNSISKLVINDGIRVYTVDRNPEPGPIYVAMIPIYNRRTVRIYAVTDGNEIYEKCVTGKDISAGKMYPLSLRMTKAGKDILLGDYGIAAMPQRIAALLGGSAEDLSDNDIQDFIFQNLHTFLSWSGVDNSRTDPNTGDSVDDADLLVGGADGDILFGQGNGDILFGDASLSGIVGWLNLSGYEWSFSNYKTALEAMTVNTLNVGLDYLENETDGDDIIYGGDGNDMLFGLGGEDEMHGGDGDDMLLGGSGDDTLDGGRGDDYLSGGDGEDTVNGGEGVDIIRYASEDTIDGGESIDILSGTIDDGSLADISNVSNVELFLKMVDGLTIDELSLTSLSRLSSELGMYYYQDRDEEDVIEGFVLSRNVENGQWEDIVTDENGITTITFTSGIFSLILETSLYVTGNPENGEEITLTTKKPEEE